MEAKVVYSTDNISAAEKLKIEEEFVSAYNYFAHLRNGFLDKWNDEFLKTHNDELIEEEYNAFIKKKSNIIAKRLNEALNYRVKIFADDTADTYGEVIIKNQIITMRIEIVD